jgi:hypothetical protein
MPAIRSDQLLEVPARVTGDDKYQTCKGEIRSKTEANLWAALPGLIVQLSRSISG